MSEELREKAKAATPGKWCQFHPGYVESAKGTPVTQWDTSHDVSAVVDGKKTKRIATFTHADDAAYLDAANPTAILALLDERDFLLSANEGMRKALERMITTYANMQDGDGNPCPDVQFARAALSPALQTEGK